jgi:hypothetical protein
MKLNEFMIVCMLFGATSNTQAQIKNGFYTIKLAASGKGLDADFPNIKNNGCIVHLWDFKKESITQNWIITKLDNKADNPFSTYKITLAASGKALDAEQTNIFINDCKVRLWDDNKGVQSQAWYIKALGNNKFQIVLAASGKALDADAPNINNNDCIVHLWDKRNDGFKTQTWIIQPSQVKPVPPPPLPPNGQGEVRDHRGEPANTRALLIEETATEKKYQLSMINPMTAEDQALWNKAVNGQLGIIGSDYRGFEDIGSAAFERAAEAIYIPNNLNFWYPQKQTSPQPTTLKYYKRTLMGMVDTRQKPEVQDIKEEYNDFDVNIHIVPFINYNYFITEAHKPEMSKKQFIKEVASNVSKKHPWVTYINGCPDKFYTVEAEIELGNDAEEKFLPLINQLPGKGIGVYGPWVWDEGHCHQPEIHPSEQIWWSDNINNKKTYFFNLFCDASQRFWWRSQMDDGTKVKPWGAPPIKGVFAIAFEVDLGNGIAANSIAPKIFEVQHISEFNVRDYSKTDQLIGNKTHNLVYNGRTIISFIPHNNNIKVSFEKLGTVSEGIKGNKIRGFLVLETEVGSVSLLNNGKVNIPPFNSMQLPPDADPNKVPEAIEKIAFKKVDGHYMFKVIETTKNSTPVHTEY